jgi:sterol desaturase/sphingolipid hydroxylase (fatty acid hydroxylase superfamily)
MDIIEHEVTIRLVFFFSIFAAVAIFEQLRPRKKRVLSLAYRWVGNIGIVFFNSFLVRIAFPVVATTMAGIAASEGWGIFNRIDLPVLLEIVMAVMILDCIIYFQHVMFHAVPLLWRLHRMHHSDVDIDVTTGARFHPIEIILSMAIKITAVILIGPSVVAVIIFEVLLNGTAMFNHGNIRLPEKIDRVLRIFLVTPDMHRVHHSVHMDEANKNFGFNLPWWDYIFGTYKSQPRDGHEDMLIGTKEFRETKYQSILGMLAQPFLRK